MSWSAPSVYSPSIGTISPWSVESIGIALAATNTPTAPAAANWPSANLGIYVPFELPNAVTVTSGFYYSNATTGNIDIGVYNGAGTRLVSAGSTAGATGWVNVTLTSTLLQPGRYYMAFARSATASTFRVAAATPIDAAMGVKQQASALALPGTATFADAATGYIPVFGLSISSVAL